MLIKRDNYPASVFAGCPSASLQDAADLDDEPSLSIIRSDLDRDSNSPQTCKLVSLPILELAAQTHANSPSFCMKNKDESYQIHLTIQKRDKCRKIEFTQSGMVSVVQAALSSHLKMRMTQARRDKKS